MFVEWVRGKAGSGFTPKVSFIEKGNTHPSKEVAVSAKFDTLSSFYKDKNG